MLSVKDSLLLKIKKHEKYQICVMNLFSHRGITLILFGRSAIQSVCLVCTLSFNGLKSPLLKKWFSDLNLYEAGTSSDLGVQLKQKFLLMKPTHDDMIEAKAVYIQLSFERYKMKLMLHN